MSNRLNSLIASLTLLLLTFLLQPTLAAPLVISPNAPTNLFTRTNQDSSGQLRIIHATAETGPVNLLVDGEPLVTNIAYRTASDWHAIAPGNHTLQLTTNNNTQTAQIQLNIPPSQAMSIIVYKERNKPALLVYEQPADLTPPDQAYLIAVNAAPTAPVLYALTDGSRLSEIPPIPYSRATRAALLPANTYALSWQTEQNATGRIIEEAAGIVFEEGYLYTAVITGDAVEPLILADFVGTTAPPTQESPTPSPNDQTAANTGEQGVEIRMINALAEPVTVAVLLNGSELFADLHPHTASNYTIIPAAENNQLRIMPANAPHEPAYLIDELPALDAHQTTILLYGPIDAIQVQAVPAQANNEQPEMAHLRVWHAVPEQTDLLIRVDNPLQPYTSPPISLGTPTASIPLPAGAYDIQVLDANDATLLAIIPTLALDNHTTYDLLLLPGENETGFSLALLNETAPQ